MPPIYMDLEGQLLEAPKACKGLELSPVFVWTCGAGGWTDLDVSVFANPPMAC